jgi:hypothetical protein
MHRYAADALGDASFRRNEAEGFEKSLLSNLVRDETVECRKL